MTLERGQMTLAREDLARIHFVNTLLAQVTGHDLYLAQQIAEAIAFSLTEFEEQTSQHPDFAVKYDAAFNAAAAQLLEKLFQQTTGRGFYHWNAARTLSSATPLFARSEIMSALKHLAPYREATLLITNLRPALLPPERRVTAKRTREYEDAVAFVRELIAARSRPNSELQVIFL